MTELMDVLIRRVIFGYIFDSSHNIISQLKRSTYSSDDTEQVKVPERIRASCAVALSRRFRWYGLASMALAPFYFVWQSIMYIFQYGEEFRSNPTALGARYV